ncbi:translation initiation factor IF-2 subunit beta [Candidatus Woesearchaeota archaeon CG_4_10_14_0_2_um_filter_33_10]|nr:MAG: translation initiation factor IF-2 subunit beta [Candidatus Woesearchaeota archaeon CG1_02_33_12]PIN79312.1 MAG: translation initiation factor IF-2 subunit beta [Candidatus Woesearchaeota archaeon CG10_big_fil_rev_8_21_14_0_10_33_12]PIU72733.1 MAG: translation initiation factor IF-2 subunit beta [Candidatus Woesearchaeota archaeon CG06_land_8_20_14_3_00_33_13]PIZ52645.1 MAG: translation initiation factor IF-2 subunit beta [Candidatus Woesearchaeota archaeon CG_4_10_14_0_2_um_filter_33_10
MDYEKMLKKARKELPEIISKKERFEIPKVIGHIQGNKTIISNFNQIADVIQRNPEHLLKYILKELATPGDLKSTGLLIGSKVSAVRINEKIKQYVDIFVMCPECRRPDTKLVKEGNITYLECLACGARRPVKTKI